MEVAGGTYNESLYFNIPSGISWDQPFTLRARPGDVVIIKPDAFGNAVADGMDYYSVIDGFVFDGANTWQHQIVIGNCCDPQTRFVRFQNNDLINNRFGGFFVSGNNIEVVNNRVHGGFEEWAGCGQEHCFGYAFYVEGSNNLFSGNQIDDVPSWVFHVYNYYGSAHYNIVESNTIHTFGFGDHRADGILLSSGVGNQAYNNVILQRSGRHSAMAMRRLCDVKQYRIDHGRLFGSSGFGQHRC